MLRSVSIPSFSGFVGSLATGNVLPTGWSAARSTTGVYVITHNLNLSSNTKLALVSGVINPTGGFSSISAESPNATTIAAFDLTGGALMDLSFYFNGQVV